MDGFLNETPYQNSRASLVCPLPILFLFYLPYPAQSGNATERWPPSSILKLGITWQKNICPRVKKKPNEYFEQKIYYVYKKLTSSWSY